jgi:hypothetical protein
MKNKRALNPWLSLVSKGVLYIIVSFFSISTFSQSSSIPRGDGTSNFPYLISNAAELTWVADSTNAGSNWSAGKYFLQTADIDLSAIANWTPIGSSTSTFKGFFDGGGHETQNLKITGTNSYAGLFGRIDDANLVNLNIFGDSISGQSYVGGAVGAAEGANVLIQNVHTNVSVYGGGTRIGGVVGNFEGGQLINCSSKGNTSGASESVGGIIGYLVNGKIQNNTSKGKVSTNSSVQGSIGGFIGRVENTDTISIINAYSIGEVSAQANTSNEGVGGLIGRIHSGGDSTFIQHAFSAALLTETSGPNIGGLVGATNTDYHYDSIYWDTVATGILTTINNLGTPLDSAQAQSDSIYKAAGWTFMGSGTMGTSDYWGYNGPTTNQGYPFLFFEEDLVQTGCNVSMAGACFPTLKEAFDSINIGSISGDIEIRINHSTTESATAVLTRNLGLSGSTLKIYPGKSGVIVSGDINGPIIQFNGANNATLDGRPMQVGIGANMLVRNNNTGSAATAVSITATNTNSASNNTVQYVKMECGKGAASSNGVLTIENADNNTAQYNDIRGTSYLSAYTGIYLNLGMGNSISYNRIHDFFDRNIGAKGVFIGASETNANIEFNEIYQTDSVTISLSSASYIGIETH